MGAQATSLMNLNAVATTAILAYRCVTYSDAQASAVGSEVKGISIRPADIGEALELAAFGTAVIEAGAAFARGTPLVSDAQGRVIAASPVAVSVGTLAVAAGATAVTSGVANGAGSITGTPALTGCELPQHLVGYALEASTGAGALVEAKLAA